MSTPADNGPDSGVDSHDDQSGDQGITPVARPPLPPLAQEPSVPEPTAEPSEDVPARLAYRFHNPASPAETFSLPGYMTPIPSIVSDGTVFAVDGLYAPDLDADRFEELGEYDPAEHSPNAGLTKAELGEKLGLEDDEVDKALKPDLVERADTYDKANPQPPGNPGDVIEESDSE